MIDCEYLVLMPKEGLKKPIPKNLIPCVCPDCDIDCYVDPKWIKRVQRKTPDAYVKCLHCVSNINWNKHENPTRR